VWVDAIEETDLGGRALHDIVHGRPVSVRHGALWYGFRSGAGLTEQNKRERCQRRNGEEDPNREYSG